MKFGIFEWAICGGVLFAIGSYFMARLDSRDELEDEWQGVVKRVHVQERVDATSGGSGGFGGFGGFGGSGEYGGSVSKSTERFLYCERDDGTEEEFGLSAEDEELLALAPGTRIAKEAGKALPTIL